MTSSAARASGSPQPTVPGVGPRRKKRCGAPRAVNNNQQSDMTRTYVQVIIVEAAIIIALLVFGRLFS